MERDLLKALELIANSTFWGASESSHYYCANLARKTLEEYKKNAGTTDNFTRTDSRSNQGNDL